MLIEHDGKTIDTEREIRWEHDKQPAYYVASLSSGRHVIEYQIHNGTWCDQICSTGDLVLCFENVPVTHVRWVNIYSERDGYNSKAEADAAASPNRIACCKLEWQS